MGNGSFCVVAVAVVVVIVAGSHDRGGGHCAFDVVVVGLDGW